MSPGLKVRDTGSRGDSPERQVRQRSDWNFTSELICRGLVCLFFLTEQSQGIYFQEAHVFQENYLVLYF